MTKRVETDIELYKKAAEYALKEALESDKKKLELSHDDKTRLEQAIKNFFDQYDQYLETH